MGEQEKLLYSPVFAFIFERREIMAPLKQEDYFYEEYKVLPKKPIHEVKKSPPKKSEAPKKNVKGNVVLGVSIFIVALTIVLRYAMINNMNMENIKLKKELESINNINAQLQLAAERQINLSNIEEYAKNNLGFQKPQNYQIEYINVDKEDLIDNKVVTENKKGIKEILLSIVEFFE